MENLFDQNCKSKDYYLSKVKGGSKLNIKYYKKNVYNYSCDS